jgi:hypothetical protein
MLYMALDFSRSESRKDVIELLGKATIKPRSHYLKASESN